MIYLLLFVEFFKIGLFCFGGAFGMIPLIRETVLRHEWLTESRFYDLIGVAESTPGPIAVNMATYIGSVTGGPLGSIIATLGVVLPSFLIILLIASVMSRLTAHRCFEGFLKGVRPVIVGLILATGVILLAKAIGYVGAMSFHLNLPAMIIFLLLCFIAVGVKKWSGKRLSSVMLIAISASLGIAVCLLRDAFV